MDKKPKAVLFSIPGQTGTWIGFPSAEIQASITQQDESMNFYKANFPGIYDAAEQASTTHLLVSFAGTKQDASLRADMSETEFEAEVAKQEAEFMMRNFPGIIPSIPNAPSA